MNVRVVLPRDAIPSIDDPEFATDGELHAFADPGFAFERRDNGRFAGDGTTWDGSTGRSADGRRLGRIPARRLFAFAWQDDHGPDAFYGASE